jgi:hypothetical protein
MNRASLADEDLDEVLITDWWLDSDMANGPKNAERTASIKYVKDAIQAISSRIPEKLGERLTSLEAAKDRKPHWAMPILATGVVGALVIYLAWAGISLVQIKGDATAFQKGIEDRLKAIEVTLRDLQHPSPLQAFARMDQDQFSHELVRIADAASRAQRDGVTDSVENIDATQKKLAALPLNTPEASRAVSSVVSYASFVREKTGLFPNGEAVRAKPCNYFDLGNGPINVIRLRLDNLSMDGCGQRLDGLGLKNVTIRNAILTYNGGAIALENVTFVNCLFLISLPARPDVPARQLADEILIKNIGRMPTFTVSVG